MATETRTEMTDEEFNSALDRILEEITKLEKHLDEQEKRGEEHDRRMDKLEKRHDDHKRRKDAKRKADEMTGELDDTPSDGLTKEEQEYVHATTHKAEMKEQGIKLHDDSVKELVEGVRSRVRAESRCDAATFEQFEAAQVKAEKAANVWGFGADRWGQNEKLTDYRLRLLKPFLKHSPEWKNADLRQVAQTGALTGVEDAIFKSAIAAATSNDTFKHSLHKIETKDQSGRMTTKFYGDPGACWDMFKIPARRVVGFRTGLQEAKLQKI